MVKVSIPVIVNDLDHQAARLELRPGEYGFIEFDLFSGDDQHPEVYVGGDAQQVGFLISKADALALADAISQQYARPGDEVTT